MLNATVLDIRTGKTPYEKVFRTQPITTVPKTKFTGNRIEPNDNVISSAATTGAMGHALNDNNEEDILSSTTATFNHDQDLSQQQQLVTEEIVEHCDMATMHHNGVVLVGVDGMEHTAEQADKGGVEDATAVVPAGGGVVLVGVDGMEHTAEQADKGRVEDDTAMVPAGVGCVAEDNIVVTTTNSFTFFTPAENIGKGVENVSWY